MKPAPPACSLPVWRAGEGGWQAQPDTVAEECPVALVYNGISHAVMMATPADLPDFALGFSLSEGIIRRPDQLYDVDIVAAAEGLELRLDIASACQQALQQRRRQLAGRTGCGVCGVEALAQLPLQPPAVSHTQTLQVAALAEAFTALQQQQPLFASTGASHAAGWWTADGGLALVREDVGRHNALDKLIGARSRRTELTAGCLLLSSRASYEMLYKAAQAGIEIVVSLSVPTALAVRLAEQAGQTLLRWHPRHGVALYSHPQRVIQG